MTNPHPTPLRGATFSHEWEKDSPNHPMFLHLQTEHGRLAIRCLKITLPLDEIFKSHILGVNNSRRRLMQSTNFLFSHFLFFPRAAR